MIPLAGPSAAPGELTDHYLHLAGRCGAVGAVPHQMASLQVSLTRPTPSR